MLRKRHKPTQMCDKGELCLHLQSSSALSFTHSNTHTRQEVVWWWLVC